MNFLKRYYWIFLSVFMIALDQLTKYLVNSFIPLGDSVEIVPRFFYLTHVRNDGAAMGILSGHRWVFMVFTVIIIVAGLFFLCSGKIKNQWGVLAATMIISGGIGNMIDRLFLGEVVDFFSFIFWGYEFYVFNVADIFVCCGVFILALYVLFSSDLDEKPAKEEVINESV